MKKAILFLIPVLILSSCMPFWKHKHHHEQPQVIVVQPAPTPPPAENQW